MTDDKARKLQCQVNRQRHQIRTLAWCLAVVVLWLLAREVSGGVVADAWADRKAHPVERQPFLWYFTTLHLPADQQLETLAALRYVVASTTSVVPLERQRLVRIRRGLYRVDIAALGWHPAWNKVLAAYPYRTHAKSNPLVIRSDWFVRYLTDQKESGQLYFEFIYGKPLEKLEQLIELTQADVKSDLTFGRIVDESGVAIPRNGGTRLVKVYPTSRRLDLWSTFDSAKVTAEADPLERLDLNGFEFDAQEHIGGLTKSWSVNGRRDSGHMQVFALSNGDGAIQAVAPIDIVHDTTVTGPELINPRSCMSCHAGYKPLQDSLARFVQSGAEVYAPKEKQEQIDDFFGGGIDSLLDSANQSYARALKAVNGLTPEQNATAYQRTVWHYEKQLSAADVARELNIPLEDLAKALAYWNNAGNKLTARAAQLAHGVGISRVRFEEDYPLLASAVFAFKRSQK